MSVKTDTLPPVPQHDPPIDKQGPQARFTASWMRWFLQVKAKVDVINSSVASLSQLVANGLTAKDAAGDWRAIEIVGTTDRIEVTNGDAVAGNPTINISNSYVASISQGGTGANDATTARDNLGAAAKLQVTGTTATGGTADVLPAQPVGYVDVDIGGVTKKIPYYN